MHEAAGTEEVEEQAGSEAAAGEQGEGSAAGASAHAVAVAAVYSEYERSVSCQQATGPRRCVKRLTK